MCYTEGGNIINLEVLFMTKEEIKQKFFDVIGTKLSYSASENTAYEQRS